MRNQLVLSKMLALFLFFGAFFATLNAQNAPAEIVTRNGQQYYRHTVSQGEGLLGIARIFSVSVAEILRHNPDANAGLQPGQELFIPVSASQIESTATALPAASGATFRHTVSRGETVFSIAQMYNTTVADINRYNPNVSEGINEGQVLLVPFRRTDNVAQDNNVRYHTILPQETLFSVARAYSLRPDDLIAANPGLSAETFHIGRTIHIPVVETTPNILPGHIRHVVQAGETLFSLSRQYNVEIDDIIRSNPMLADGLRTDMELQIPTGNLYASTQQLFTPLASANVIRVGLLLPFNDETNNAHHRMQEFLEGFLLAADRLKEAGANIEIYSFDSGHGNDTRRLESRLETIEWQSLNLIIGGINEAQIRVMSEFARAYNIKHVIPFRQNVAEVQNNPQVFQVNQPPNVLNMRASNEFMRLFGSANIIFVTGGDNNRMDFVNQLQGDLRRNNVSFESILASNELDTAIRPLLSATQQNVIVPTSDRRDVIRLIMNELEEVQDASPNYVLRLFGYPDWQTYTELIRRFHQFGTYIFTAFYIEQNHPETRAVFDSFRRWYGRAPMVSFPNWALWGYDTGLFFLTALHRHGANFEQHISQIRVPTLQHAFHFERTNNWGGFINTGMFLVRFDTTGAIHKIDRSR